MHDKIIEWKTIVYAVQIHIRYFAAALNKG